MFAFLFSALFIGKSLHLSAGGFIRGTDPVPYGIASKSVFGRRTKNVDGKLYIGGHSDGAFGTGAVGGFDIFIRKYPSSNPSTSAPLWTKMFGTASADYLGDFDVDASGNVYVAGMCSGTLNSVGTKGSGDACIFKLDSTGAVKCSAQFGGTGVDRFNGVALDEPNGFFYATGNTTSTSFAGTTTVGKASGIFYRFQMSNCAQAGNNYVQSMPLATQTMHFGDVVVLSTGQAVVGFALTTPSALPGITNFNIAGYSPVVSSTGCAFGFINVNTTTAGGSVPVKANGTIVENLTTDLASAVAGGYVNDMVHDADDNIYVAGTIMLARSSASVCLKTDKSFLYMPKEVFWIGLDVYMAGQGIDVNNETGVVLMAGRVHQTPPETNYYPFRGSGRQPPMAIVTAYTFGTNSISYRGYMNHMYGFAEHLTRIGPVEYLGLGYTYATFNGIAGPGVVDTFTYPFEYILPTAKPTIMPTFKPTKNPIATPTAKPTTTPPSAQPVTLPTSVPSSVPSSRPTKLEPSSVPSRRPSAIPSVCPSSSPSAAPSAGPSAVPSVTPSARPSKVVPSAVPSSTPSAAPSVYPSSSPSAIPSAVPSVAPSTASPTTTAPSAIPSAMPTATPTGAPTNRPTDSTAVNLVLDVTQTVYNLDVASYNAQKVAFNVTFQRTIAATLDGIFPEGITDIQVAQKTTADRIRAHAGTVPQCSLKYTLTMFDAQVEFSVFRAQLVEAVSAGTMDAHFRHYAGQHGIDNSSYFGEAQAVLQGDGSSDDGLTGVMIAGIVIGVMMAIAFCVAAVGFGLKRENSEVVSVQVDENTSC